jgi:hypothetical protein
MSVIKKRRRISFDYTSDERYPRLKTEPDDLFCDDPRPDPKDNAEREKILDNAPKDLKPYLIAGIELSFGVFPLLETRNFYDHGRASTLDKRALVGKWLEACKERRNRRSPYRKIIFNFLQWRFKCPGCKEKKTSDSFAYDDFTLKISEDENSDPVLKSTYFCQGCPKR